MSQLPSEPYEEFERKTKDIELKVDSIKKGNNKALYGSSSSTTVGGHHFKNLHNCDITLHIGSAEIGAELLKTLGTQTNKN